MSSLRTWETGVTAEFRGASPLDLLKTLLFEQTLREGEVLYSETVAGYANSVDIIKTIQKIEGLNQVYTNLDSESDNIEVYVREDSNYSQIVQIMYTDNHIDVVTFCDSEIHTTRFCARIREQLSDAPIRGTVHMLAYEQNFYLSQLGEVNAPLERGNYIDEVLSQYDRVVEDLLSSIPSGRLTLLDGDPGTGKSFLLRGLISAAKGLFIYIPAAITGRLTGPDIIPILMREKDKEVPIILIMEDADSSLATRQLDNVSRLSDLLNMSDGILGDMADIRIIATTNSRKDDLDSAVLRDGRRNEYIQLKPLTIAHGQDILNRLLGRLESGAILSLKKEKVTLAEVYNKARKLGWKPIQSPRNKRRNYPAPRDYDY